MTFLGFNYGALVFIVIGVMLFFLPIGILLWGIIYKGKRSIIIGSIWLFTLLALVAIFVDLCSASRERILDAGMLPDGREYVLMQLWNGEPYRIDLYVRNSEGKWIFHYVEHETFPWLSGGHVEFTNKMAKVFKGDELYRDVELNFPSNGNESHYPASFTAADLFQGFRKKRARKDEKE